MIVLNTASLQNGKTEWGKAVSKQLVDKNLKQQDLVTFLVNQGFEKTDKSFISKLLSGIGTSTHMPEIEAINKLLDIQLN